MKNKNQKEYSLEQQPIAFNFVKKLVHNKKIPNCLLFIGFLKKENYEIVQEVSKLITNENDFDVYDINKGLEDQSLSKEKILQMIDYCNHHNDKKTIFIINNVDTLTVQVSNSILKLMENVKNFYFLMTAINESKVLKTILSRSQKIHLIPNDYKNIDKIIINNLDIKTNKYNDFKHEFENVINDFFQKNEKKYNLGKINLLKNINHDTAIISFELIINMVREYVIYDLSENHIWIKKYLEKYEYNQVIIFLDKIMNLYNEFSKLMSAEVFVINLFADLELYFN